MLFRSPQCYFRCPTRARHEHVPNFSCLGITLSVIVSILKQNLVDCGKNIPIFKLLDLHKIYVEVLECHGHHVDGRTYNTQLQRNFVTFQWITGAQRRKVLLAFKHDIGDTIATAGSIDHNQFIGHFEAGCQGKFIPTSLQALGFHAIARSKTTSHKQPIFYTSYADFKPTSYMWYKKMNIWTVIIVTQGNHH